MKGESMLAEDCGVTSALCESTAKADPELPVSQGR